MTSDSKGTITIGGISLDRQVQDDYLIVAHELDQLLPRFHGLDLTGVSLALSAMLINLFKPYSKDKRTPYDKAAEMLLIAELLPKKNITKGTDDEKTTS